MYAVPQEIVPAHGHSVATAFWVFSLVFAVCLLQSYSSGKPKGHMWDMEVDDVDRAVADQNITS